MSRKDRSHPSSDRFVDLCELDYLIYCIAHPAAVGHHDHARLALVGTALEDPYDRGLGSLVIVARRLVGEQDLSGTRRGAGAGPRGLCEKAIFEKIVFSERYVSPVIVVGMSCTM